VDLLFDHLSRVSDDNSQNHAEPAVSTPAAGLRSFPAAAPQLPAYSPLAPSPFHLSSDRHSPVTVTDLNATDQHATTHPAINTLTHHR